MLKRLTLFVLLAVLAGLPGIASAQVTDTFGRGPTSAGAVGNGWLDSGSAYLINSSNQLTLAASVNGNSANYLLRPTGEIWANGTVSVTGHPWTGATTNDTVRELVRYQDANDYYAAEFDYGYPTSGTTLSVGIKKVVGGTTTNLTLTTQTGNKSITGVSGHEYVLKTTAAGSTLFVVCYDGGTNGLGTTVMFSGYAIDTSISASGQQGINLGYYNSASTAQTGNAFVQAFSASPSTPLAANDSHVFWSPGNVYFSGSGYAQITQNCTYFKVGFTGTSLSLLVDISAYHTNSIAASGWGKWLVSVDGGAPSDQSFTDPGSGVGTQVIALAENLAVGNHTAQVWFDLFDETDTYTPKDAQVVQSLLLDNGSALLAPSGAIALLPKRAMVLGDSITKGYDAANAASTSTNYPPSIFAYVLGQALNAEVGVTGLSGQGWTRTQNAWTSTFPSTFGQFDSTHTRTWPTLDYLVIAQGTNDSTNNVTSTAQTLIGTARTAVGVNTWIILASPFNGSHASEIAAAVSGYQAANPSDRRVAYVNSSTIFSLANTGTFFTVDGTHPTATGHAQEAAILASLIQQAVAQGALNLPVGGQVKRTR